MVLSDFMLLSKVLGGRHYLDYIVLIEYIHNLGSILMCNLSDLFAIRILKSLPLSTPFYDCGLLKWTMN